MDPSSRGHQCCLRKILAAAEEWLRTPFVLMANFRAEQWQEASLKPLEHKLLSLLLIPQALSALLCQHRRPHRDCRVQLQARAMRSGAPGPQQGS